MKNTIIILVMLIAGLFSCRQGSKSALNNAYIETPDSAKNIKSQKQLTNHNGTDFYTKYEYTDSIGMSLIIKNGFPRGGTKYTDPNGEVYGAHGTMRTELSLKGQDLFYRIKIDGSKSNSKSSDKEIYCGKINLNLK